jgi:hypothetical protein
MLTKLKRFYSENSSIGVPNPISCVKLVSITAERISEEEIVDLQIKYIVCGDEYDEEITQTISSLITDKETLTINTCIKSNSLYIGGVNITEDGVYETSDWSINVSLGICTAPNPVVTYSALRSEDGLEDPDDGCSILNVTIPVYISTSIEGQLTTNDVVYSDLYGTVPFNGENKYYALKLDTQATKTICLVSNTGMINVFSFCL